MKVWVAQLETVDGQGWTSVHESDIDAKQQLHEKVAAWGLGHLESDLVRSYAVGGYEVAVKVWHLTAEISNAADFDGITTLHQTREGAVAAFEEWLAKAGIPTEVAYDGVQWTGDNFIGGDCEHGDTVLHWGIQPMKVQD